MGNKLNKSLILNRIKEAYNLNGNSELARFLGVAPNTITNWYNRNSIDFDIIFSKCENINVDWLLTGNGNMLKEEKQPVLYKEPDYTSMASASGEKYGLDNEISVYGLNKNYSNADKQEIPLYELKTSAELDMLFSNQQKQNPVDFISVPNSPKVDGAIYVKGDSMHPILKAGDIVCYKLINERKNIRYGEIYLLYINDGDDEYLTIKYIQKSDLGKDYFRLVSHNPHHDPKDEPILHIKAIAIVKLSIRYNT